jgi:hypothetical protein
VNRFRLRFLLQEIDLPAGDTLIGRSAACHVTIEDPLVSRQHARIHIRGGRATIEDLGSRNGLQVNGRAIEGVVVLKDGDRVRIGTQELVLASAVASPRSGTGPGTRPTGFMCHCAGCGLPYPAELIQCPSCGSNERSDDDTLSGVPGEPQRNWSLELLVEVLGKALSLKRWDDVERMLKRARANIDECVATAGPLDRGVVDSVAEAAGALAATRADAGWGRWVLAVYAARRWVPPPGASRYLSTLPPSERASLAPAAESVVESIRAGGGPDVADLEGFAQVESLQAARGDG